MAKPKRPQRNPAPLQTVRVWLPDYFALCDGTKMDEILADIAKCEVESAIDARNLVNRRIDCWVMWLNGTRPAAPPDFGTFMQQRWST